MRGRRAAVLVGCAALLAGLLVVLGRRPLWLDEAASSTLAALPGAAFRHVLLDREGNGLLHTLLLRGWREVLPGDLGLRVPSVLASFAAVVLLAVLAERWFGQRVALLAAVLLVANPVVVRYAVEARSYALVLALACLSTALLDRAVRRPTAASFAVYAAVLGVSVYAHYFALFLAVGHGVALLLVRLPGVRLRTLVPGGVLYILIVSGLPRLMTDDAAAGVGYLGDAPLARALPVLLAAFAVAGLALVAVAARRRTLRQPAERWPLVLTLCWLVVPLVLAVVVSALRQPVLAPRYLILCVPPAVLVLALGLDGAWRRYGRWPALSAVSLVCVLGVLLGAAYVQRQDEDWDRVGRLLATSRSGERVLFVAPYSRLPYERYHLDQTKAEPAYPDIAWGGNLEPLFFYVPLPEPAVRASLTDARGVWLVLSHVSLYGSDDPTVATVDGVLKRRFRLADTTTLDGVDVQHWLPTR